MTDIETPTATNRDGNLDSNNSNPKETKDGNTKPGGPLSPPRWAEVFLISCVIGVLIDPLFLYIPVINETDKCLRRNETVKVIALVLRSITDFAYVWHIIVRLQSASKKEGFPLSYLLIDILAILPIPQVVVLAFFSKMAGSKSLTSRRFLNILLLAQYVPRILRIYVSAKELASDLSPLTLFLWVRCVFNFCLYIIAGHVFGALWYFYSIYWETACWHHACKSLEGCNAESFFNCHIISTDKTINGTIYFNEKCPVNPTNETVYDFGIFAKAMESGTLLETTNFPRKFFKCFWWGLQHLCSFGSNLETSGDIWENLFAVIICSLGLLLFLYLIGNLQTYLQLETTKAYKTRQKIKKFLSGRKFSKGKKRFIFEGLKKTIKDGKDLNGESLRSLEAEYDKRGTVRHLWSG